MTYEVEALAATLKSVRQKKGLSQRELSSRTGVPQSHISKIETAGVDLRISSLASIANALDLEIALVPLKAVPAVNAISRGVGAIPSITPDVANQIVNIARNLDLAKASNIDTKVMLSAEHQFNELRYFQKFIRDASALRRINATLTTVAKPEASALRRVNETLTTIAKPEASALGRVNETLTTIAKPDASALRRVNETLTTIAKSEANALRRVNETLTTVAKPEASALRRVNETLTTVAKSEANALRRVNETLTTAAKLEANALRRVNDKLTTVAKSEVGAIREATRMMSSLRNALSLDATKPIEPPRGAYEIDGGDDA